MENMIDIDALYPHDGTAIMTRQYRKMFTQPWPSDMKPGNVITALDGQGWIWQVEVLSMEGEEKAKVRVVSERTPSPLPQVTNEGIVLSNVSGHAHCRNWRKGDVVQVHGQYYKVSKEPKLHPGGSKIFYPLTPATASDWAKRPGRVQMASERAAKEALGSAVQTPSGEWLHVKEVVFSRYGSAEGETFGRTWFVKGKHVPEAKAAKINETHAPSLSAKLHAAQATRRTDSMPEGAKVLIPGNPSRMCATGERVAIDGNKVVHERVGDPDMIDSRYHYMVEITDPTLLARVKKFLAS